MRKKKIKVRQFWSKSPATQVHKDEKNEYNRSKDRLEWETKLDDALLDDLDYFDDFV